MLRFHSLHHFHCFEKKTLFHEPGSKKNNTAIKLCFKHFNFTKNQNNSLRMSNIGYLWRYLVGGFNPSKLDHLPPKNRVKHTNVWNHQLDSRCTLVWPVLGSLKFRVFQASAHHPPSPSAPPPLHCVQRLEEDPQGTYLHDGRKKGLQLFGPGDLYWIYSVWNSCC